MNSKHPQRKRPASGVLYIEGQPTVIFDTVCTNSKQPWLANEKIHTILTEVWREASAWLVGRYIIMPDHVHYFAWATESGIEYENWVTYWKSRFSWKHGQKNRRMQTDHWDTRMRSESKYEEKWNYIRENSVRADLVECADDWPFQGTLYDLTW